MKLDIPNDNKINDKKINFISLYEWFGKNWSNFPNLINRRLSIRTSGIEENENLTFKIPDWEKILKKNGEPKIHIYNISNTDIIPMMDLYGLKMELFRSGYFICLRYNNKYVIKVYYRKHGLIFIYCERVNIPNKINIDFPYKKIEINNRDYETIINSEYIFETPVINMEEFTIRILDNNFNLKEILDINYPRFRKEKFEDNKDSLNWLINRKNESIDIIHHIQIIDVLLEIYEKEKINGRG